MTMLTDVTGRHKVKALRLSHLLERLCPNVGPSMAQVSCGMRRV